jgi:hypothetical protein
VLTAVAIAAATHAGSWFGRALDVAPLRWIGERSYGIYLWHWPVVVLLALATTGGFLEQTVPVAVGLGAAASRSASPRPRTACSNSPYAASASGSRAGTVGAPALDAVTALRGDRDRGRRGARARRHDGRRRRRPPVSSSQAVVEAGQRARRGIRRPHPVVGSADAPCRRRRHSDGGPRRRAAAPAPVTVSGDR